MGCLGRIAGVIFAASALLTALYYLAMPSEYTETQYAVGDCAAWSENWRVFERVSCDDDHDFELVGTVEMPAGYICSGNKDCYYGSSADRSLAAAAADACRPVALRYSDRAALPAGVETNGRGSVTGAQAAAGRPFPVWCEVRPVTSNQRLSDPLRELP